MNSSHLQQILRELRESFRCPQCGKQYALSQIQFRGHFGNLYFVQLHCPGHLPMMALAKVVSNERDWHIEKAMQLTEDDVIEFAAEIDRFDGRFSRVWHERSAN